jgi:pimeloyl-ACP methyl ester carboxylesterase
MDGENAKADVERVGLLVVHGVGEQERFATARAIARALGGTLGADPARPRFSLIERVGDADAKTAPQPLPSDDRHQSPFEIRIQRDNLPDVHIHIYEVWWADLGAPATILEQVTFWLWGLGICGSKIDLISQAPKGPTRNPSNTDKLMVEPRFPPQEGQTTGTPLSKILLIRFELFLASYLAFCTLLTWSLVKKIGGAWASRLGDETILTQYMGDVRIYTQSPAVGDGNLIDVGKPWRTTIRRRMIQETVAMTERGFDRWYIMGHSLGSVIAFNALQETEWTLPNYLDESHARRVRAATGLGLWTTTPHVPPPVQDNQPNLDIMTPRRPVWLADRDGLSRKHLFVDFRGLVTYGSPLNKFATLWPRIVGLNKQQPHVFDPRADWVNIGDATDPVSGELSAFSAAPEAWPAGGPANFRTKASDWFLYSHIEYFKADGSTNFLDKDGTTKRKPAPKRETTFLLNELAPLNGTPPGLRTAFKALGSDYGSKKARRLFASSQLVALTITLTLASAAVLLLAYALVHAIFASSVSVFWKAWTGWAYAASIGIVGGGVSGIVCLMGAIRFLRKPWRA